MGGKRLRVDLGEIGEFMRQVERYDQDYYLDTQTGEIHVIPGELTCALEEGEPLEDLPEWERAEAPLARSILAGDPRYARIPEVWSDEAWEVMRDFVDMVEDAAVRERLGIAIRGQGAFRRFREALSDHSSLRERWFAFEGERQRAWAREWLESLGIEAEDSGPTG